MKAVLMKAVIIVSIISFHITLLTARECLWQSDKGITLEAFTGEEAREYWRQIAALRIEMFQEFPYLYDGSFDYEKDYLEIYFQSKNSIILLVFDEDLIVGFSNAIPIAEEMKEIQEAFQKQNLDINTYLYIGEVMIQPQHREQGLLRKFFDYHEKYAEKNHYPHLVFMTVQRPSTHPSRPNNYRSLDPIWEHFGFQRLPNVDIKMAWKQIDTSCEEQNHLEVWKKTIGKVS